MRKCFYCGGNMLPVNDDPAEEDDDSYIVVAQCELCGAVLKESG